MKPRQTMRPANRRGADIFVTVWVSRVPGPRNGRGQRARADPTYSAIPLIRWRAMTIRWISDVPSPISPIFASRMNRSTG